jgi:hypothetical protein
MFCLDLQTRIEQIKSLPELLTLIQKDQEKLMLSKNRVNQEQLNKLRNEYLAIYGAIARRRSSTLMANQLFKTGLTPNGMSKRISKVNKTKLKETTVLDTPNEKLLYAMNSSLSTQPLDREVFVFDSFLLPLHEDQHQTELGNNLEVSYDLTTLSGNI